MQATANGNDSAQKKHWDREASNPVVTGSFIRTRQALPPALAVAVATL